jgi:polyhydroxybutyrate depolymerase
MRPKPRSPHDSWIVEVVALDGAKWIVAVTMRSRLFGSKLFHAGSLAVLALGWAAACSSDPESSDKATPGTPVTGGVIGNGGSPANGGSTPTGGKATGGTISAPTGGTIGAGGSTGGATGGTATAGLSSGGTTNGGTASGGKANGGSGGKATAGAPGGGMPNGGTPSGGAGGGGTAPGGPAEPSAGCGKANPQVGSSGSPLMVSGHQYYVKLPTGYDASKPYPTMIMFNPTNNPISWAEQSAGFEATGPKEAWIRVYPHPANSSSGWGANDVAFFAPLYEQITGAYCMDKARVFASGESSGGDFSSILGCEHADKLRAVAPCATKNVSQYPLTASSRKCTGQVASVVIHGKNDNVVGPENGPKTRDFYVALNHCGTMTMPVTGYSDTLSNCVEYQGCDAGYPVIWCQHTDPNYSNTNHGWPAFAPKYLFAMFSKL